MSEIRRVNATTTPVDSGESKKVTFTIPLRVAPRVEVQIPPGSDLAKLAKVIGDQPRPETKGISDGAERALRNAFVKNGDAYVVSSEQVDAAKRELLRFWGFPEKFVRAHASDMQIDQLPGSGSALDANGRLTGSIGDTPFEGWIHRNDDWRPADIQAVVSALIPPEPATSLTLTPDFYARNGIAKGEQKATKARLFTALSNWKTISDEEVAWAKGVLTKGYGIDGKITLEPFARGSAVDENQSVRGLFERREKDSTFGLEGTSVRGFTLALDTGTFAHAPMNMRLKVVKPG